MILALLIYFAGTFSSNLSALNRKIDEQSKINDVRYLDRINQYYTTQADITDALNEIKMMRVAMDVHLKADKILSEGDVQKAARE